jgi:MYXO-CTERM domain-containing protein
LKRIFLLGCLVVALAPLGVKAEDNDADDKPRHKHHMKANEMAGMGVGAAALVGAVGYLLLRRRHSS